MIPGEVGEETAASARQMPLGIVIARIVVVSGMSFAAAFAIFFFVGGVWQIGLAALTATIAFLFLMFAIERVAD